MDILDNSNNLSSVLDKSYYIKTNIIITSLFFALFFYIGMNLLEKQGIVLNFTNKEFIITLLLFVIWYSIVKFGSDFIIYKI
jgi:hypothetical protein